MAWSCVNANNIDLYCGTHESANEMKRRFEGIKAEERNLPRSILVDNKFPWKTEAVEICAGSETRQRYFACQVLLKCGNETRGLAQVCPKWDNVDPTRYRDVGRSGHETYRASSWRATVISTPPPCETGSPAATVPTLRTPGASSMRYAGTRRRGGVNRHDVLVSHDQACITFDAFRTAIALRAKAVCS
jgi:hypothetical protein